jgi:hypothetical protein
MVFTAVLLTGGGVPVLLLLLLQRMTRLRLVCPLQLLQTGCGCAYTSRQAHQTRGS